MAPAHRQRGYAMPADAAGRQRRLVARGQPDRRAELCSDVRRRVDLLQHGLVLHHRHPDGRRLSVSGAVRPDDHRRPEEHQHGDVGRPTGDPGHRQGARGARSQRHPVLRGERRAVRVAAAENRRRRAEDGGQGRGGVLRAGLGECPKKVDESVCDVENDRGAPTFDACDPTDPCCTHADVADAEWCPAELRRRLLPEVALPLHPEARHVAVGDRSKLPSRLRQRLRVRALPRRAGRSSRPWRTASTSACV